MGGEPRIRITIETNMLVENRAVRIGGIDWPEPLIDALNEDRLVVFAGAGVSMGEPSNLPDFEGLADQIARGQSRKLKRVKVEDTDVAEPVIGDENTHLYRLDEPIDTFLGELDRNDIDVRERACRLLKEQQAEHSNLHTDLLRLFREPSKIRVVTTNFDTLFEKAALSRFGIREAEGIDGYQVKGGYLNGIYHIHGDWDDPSSVIIADSDFAKGYINPGTIRQYLMGLFQQFSVLFVGYSLSDTLMRYLSMAIEVSAMPRYVLTDDPDPNRWRMFNMTPIAYTESPNHRALVRGVDEFADFANWSDVDWEREISRIAVSGIPKPKEQEDLIDLALRESARARIFRNSATSPEWVAWLEQRGYMSSLFEQRELNSLQSILSRWIADSHAIQNPNQVFELFARYPGSMNPRFWIDIVQVVSNSRNADIPNATLRRWLSVLTARSPSYIDEHLAVMLIETASNRNETLAEALAFLERFIETRVIDKVPHPANSRRSMYLRDDGLAWSLRMIWTHLSSRIGAIAEPLTKVIERSILSQHEIVRTWSEDDLHGPWLYEFDPIPVLNENDPRSPGAVLIGIAANLLAWIAQDRPQYAEGWVDIHRKSPVDILRRLAVGTVPYLDWEPDAKIEWLIRNGFVSDRTVLIEAQVLAKNAFLRCGGAMRETLVTSIVAGNPEPRGCTCDMPMSDDRQFDWLSKLHAVDPGCQVVNKALKPLNESHPEWDVDAFAERESVSTAVYRVSEESLIPVDELLSKPVSVVVDELLAYAPQSHEIWDGDDVVRKSVSRTVFEATSQDIDWGLSLASELVRRSEWRNDIWRALIEVWEKDDLTEQQHRIVLGFFTYPILIEHHGVEIARNLRRLVGNNGKHYGKNLIPAAKNIARLLWNASSAETPRFQGENWLMQSINSIAGEVVSFWLSAVWLQKDCGQSDDMSLGSEDWEFLNLVVDDESDRGKLGKVILAQCLWILTVIDSDWVKNRMLSLFDTRNQNSIPVWDGIANIRVIPSQLVELIRPCFLEAAKCLDNRDYWQGDDLRRGFISRYVFIMTNHVSDPIPEWVPAFFDNSTDNDRVEFAMQIREILAGATDTQRTCWWETWLKEYWQNRLEGVPARLEPKEIGMMMQWPKHLGPQFAEAVDFAMNTPFEAEFVSRFIVDCEVAEQHPSEAAELMLFIDASAPETTFWHQMDEVFVVLLRSELDEDVKSRIENIKEKRTLGR